MSNLQKNIIITSIGHFLVHAMTMILPVILVILEEEFSVSIIYLGGLVTTQILFLGFGGFPAGIMADRFGSKIVLMIYFTGLIISSIWLYFSTTFIMVAIGLGLLGVVAGLYHPAGLKLVSNSPNVARYMSYHGISGSLGLAAGPFYGSWMSNWYDWRTAYLLLGCVAFLGLIFLIINHQESGRGLNKLKLKFSFNNAQIIIIAVGALWGIAHHGLFNFLPLYFKESIYTGWDVNFVSGFLLGFVLILGIIGQLLGGMLGERFERKNLYTWAVGLNIPFLIIVTFFNGWTLVGIAGILGAVNFMFQPIHNSLLADETGSNQRGIVYGFSAGISFGVGSLAGIIGGYIGDVFSINYIFSSMTVFLVPALILAILLKKIK